MQQKKEQFLYGGDNILMIFRMKTKYKINTCASKFNHNEMLLTMSLLRFCLLALKTTRTHNNHFVNIS